MLQLRLFLFFTGLAEKKILTFKQKTFFFFSLFATIRLNKRMLLFTFGGGQGSDFFSLIEPHHDQLERVIDGTLLIHVVGNNSSLFKREPSGNAACPLLR